jgi:hypothetical protein
MQYGALRSHFGKGLRNGNWHHLSYREKGLYRAALLYTRVKGEIVNAKLGAMVSRIVEKLRETPGLRILRNGLEEAKRMLSTDGNNCVFTWCPEFREWLGNPDYLFWLGRSTSSTRFIRHAHRLTS